MNKWWTSFHVWRSGHEGCWLRRKFSSPQRNQTLLHKFLRIPGKYHSFLCLNFPGSSFPFWHFILPVFPTPSGHLIFLVRPVSSLSRGDRPTQEHQRPELFSFFIFRAESYRVDTIYYSTCFLFLFFALMLLLRHQNDEGLMMFRSSTMSN